MLKPGQFAPDFSVVSTKGETVSLDSFKGKRLVMFFFPKAFTTGCTLEVRAFQKAYPLFLAQQTEVIGVSVDSQETQCEFAKQEQVSFPMIADESKTLSKLYDTLWPIIRKNRRVTYIIDRDKRISACFSFELNAEKHIQETLDFLRKPSTQLG